MEEGGKGKETKGEKRKRTKGKKKTRCGKEMDRDGKKRAGVERARARKKKVGCESRYNRGSQGVARFDFDVQLKVHFPLSRHFAVFEECRWKTFCPNGWSLPAPWKFSDMQRGSMVGLCAPVVREGARLPGLTDRKNSRRTHGRIRTGRGWKEDGTRRGERERERRRKWMGTKRRRGWQQRKRRKERRRGGGEGGVRGGGGRRNALAFDIYSRARGWPK